VSSSASNKGLKSTYDTLIVLGNPAKDDGTPNRILRARLNKALELYLDGVSKTIIVTGGAAHNFYLESEVMANYLVEHGVENKHIIQDQISLNTIDNAQNCAKIMATHGLKTALIVTSSFHKKRAKLLFEKQNLEVDIVSGVESLFFRLVTLPLYPLEWILRKIIDKRNPWL